MPEHRLGEVISGDRDRGQRPLANGGAKRGLPTRHAARDGPMLE
jgi:hypothetical protein